jgi:adenylate cyclase class 1
MFGGTWALAARTGFPAGYADAPILKALQPRTTVQDTINTIGGDVKGARYPVPPRTRQSDALVIDTAIDLNFAEGIDRKTLVRLRDRFLTLNRGRYRQALQALGSRQQVVLELLPLILHGNHPTLPGYLDATCPHGIACYEPSPALIELGRRHSRSFRWRSQRRRTADIEALFIMGSPGSIAHAADSDVDVWLCHRDDLSESGRAMLGRKARAISDWASTLGLELHIFLLSGGQLRSGRLEEQADVDNCGSAQHFLLLDEFYRTAIHLAGRYPLWWLIPADQEARYDVLADHLRQRRFIKPDEYLDLGSVPRIPVGEFLGAGVWQLYKGIEAPWKAILKLLLIESYACDEGLRPLALSLKRAVYAGQSEPEWLDPYIMLYQHLEAFLEGDSKGRLALLRQAFYLKTGVHLSRVDSTVPAWRRRQVEALVQSWGWGRDQLRWLDNRHRWRVEDVQRERRGIVGELTRSYRFLSRLARSQRRAATIQPRDMALLGRKLYAAFQRKAGKVEMVNPNIAPDLGEENLAFHHTDPDRCEGAGWRLYRDLIRPDDVHRQPVIKHSAGLLELLVWCHCNGLLTPATRLNLQAGSTQATLSELRALIQALADELPAYPLLAPREDLMADSRTLEVMLFVNVGVDPLHYLTEQGIHKLSNRHDALGYSSSRENLVATLDVVTLNSWREINVSRYERGDTLIQYLQHFLAQVAASSGKRPRLGVHCYCAGRAGAIARRVEAVFNDVVGAFFPAGQGPQSLRYVLEMDERFFILQFVGAQPRFLACRDRTTLQLQLAEPQPHWSTVVLDRQAMSDDYAWHTVCQAARPDALQLFFEVVGAEARLWLSDETGALFHWTSPYSGNRHLLEPLLRFLETILERRQLRQQMNASDEIPPIDCLELCRSGKAYRAEPRAMTADRLAPDSVDVQAIGRAGSGTPAHFDLYCDDREFSALEYGDALFREVASYVMARRRNRQPYPVYITDLHLPQDLDSQGEYRELSSAQYLRYKVNLEQSLNLAVAGLLSAS